MKNSNKTILTVILCCLVLVSSIPVSFADNDEFNTIELLEDSTGQIIDYTMCVGESRDFIVTNSTEHDIAPVVGTTSGVQATTNLTENILKSEEYFVLTVIAGEKVTKTNTTRNVCISYKDINNEIQIVNMQIKIINHIESEEIEVPVCTATCISKGSSNLVVSCENCGKVLSETPIEIDENPDVHTPKEAVVDNYKDAGYGVEGSYDSVVYCKDCNVIISKNTIIIPALDLPIIDFPIVTVNTNKNDEENNITDEDTPLSSGFTFSDINVNDWFYDDVVYMYMNNLMNGVSDDAFGAELATSRGMIVTILYRMEGSPEVSGKCPFADVATGSYYEKAITWAAANGIVLGYANGNFGPDDLITREQLTAILYRYASFKGINVDNLADLSAYKDASSISNYAVTSFQWAKAIGLVNGTSDTTLSPTATAQRCHAAAMLHRMSDMVK